MENSGGRSNQQQDYLRHQMKRWDDRSDHSEPATPRSSTADAAARREEYASIATESDELGQGVRRGGARDGREFSLSPP